jgi:hypothetical protein
MKTQQMDGQRASVYFHRIILEEMDKRTNNRSGYINQLLGRHFGISEEMKNMSRTLKGKNLEELLHYLEDHKYIHMPKLQDVMEVMLEVNRPKVEKYIELLRITDQIVVNGRWVISLRYAAHREKNNLPLPGSPPWEKKKEMDYLDDFNKRFEEKKARGELNHDPIETEDDSVKEICNHKNNKFQCRECGKDTCIDCCDSCAGSEEKGIVGLCKRCI